MVLAFHARQSTKDVDAIFVPAADIRALAAEVARDRGLDEDWINDGVKRFVSSRASLVPLEVQFTNLSMLMPVPEYLLAMKCMAARAGESSRDMEDVKFLIRHLHLDSAAEALLLVEAYYPASRITVKTRYFVEAAFEELATPPRRRDDVSPHEGSTHEENARHPL